MKKGMVKIIASLLLILSFSMISLVSVSAEAFSLDELVEDIQKDIQQRQEENEANKKAKELNEVKYASDSFYEGLTEIINVLKQNPKKWMNREPKAVADQVSGILKSVGSVLVILFYGIGVFKTSYSYIEHRQWGTTFKGLFRLALAWGFAAMAPDIAYDIFDIGTGLINSVTNGVDMSPPSADWGWTNACDNIDDLGLIGDGRTMLKIEMWMIRLLMHLMFIVMLVYVMGRFFKMMIYIAVSPLPMATLASEPTQVHAISFLKALAGVALEGLVIILALKIYMVVVNGSGDGLLGTTYIPFSDGDSIEQKAIKAYLMTVVVNAFGCCAVVIGADKMVQKAFGT